MSAPLPPRSHSRLPLVTVVTPSLDHGRYISKAVDSVLGQDYPRIEYIVIDGGSSDGTIETLQRYGDRLRWLSEPDRGQAAAINKGVALSEGEILCWLNADDYLEPGAVGRVVRHFVLRPELMLVYGDARFVDAGGNDLGPCSQVEPFDFHRLLHHGDIIVQPAAFFRREAFDAVSGLDESLTWAMDYDLWLKMGRLFPALQIAEPLARYRLTGENKTTRGGQARFEEIAAVGLRHGAGGPPAAFRVERLVGALREAWRLLREGKPVSGRRALVRGLTALGTSPRAWHLLLRRSVAWASRGSTRAARARLASADVPARRDRGAP